MEKGLSNLEPQRQANIMYRQPSSKQKTTDQNTSPTIKFFLSQSAFIPSSPVYVLYR